MERSVGNPLRHRRSRASLRSYYLGDRLATAGGGAIWRLSEDQTQWIQIVPKSAVGSPPVYAALVWFVNLYDADELYLLDVQGMKVSPDGGQSWIYDTALTNALTRGGKLAGPLGPSNEYSFSTAIHGIRLRSAASTSRARVSSFSLASSLSRAAFHSPGETIGGVFIWHVPLQQDPRLACRRSAHRRHRRGYHRRPPGSADGAGNQGTRQPLPRRPGGTI